MKKKLLTYVLCSVLAVSCMMTGCGKKDVSADNHTQETATEMSSEEATETTFEDSSEDSSEATTEIASETASEATTEKSTEVVSNKNNTTGKTDSGSDKNNTTSGTISSGNASDSNGTTANKPSGNDSSSNNPSGGSNSSSNNATNNTTNNTKPSESTKPTEATKPSESTKPSEETKPTEATKPTEETKPTEPAKPDPSTCNHDYQRYYDMGTWEPTCGTTGHGLYKCTKCGHSYGVTLEPTGQHNYVEKHRIDSDCTSQGYIYWDCTVCHDHYEEPLPLDPNNHDASGICDGCEEEPNHKHCHGCWANLD